MTPGGALRAAGADPGASSGEEGAFRGPGAEGAGARRNGARLPGHGAGQRLVWRRTPGPSGAGASATCPAGRAAAEWPTGDPPAEGLARGGEMNGFSTEEDSREGPPAAPAAAPGYGQSCCLIEDGERCVRPAGNASFSKRVQKSISQKKLKLDIDKSVSPPPPLPPAPCPLPGLRAPPPSGRCPWLRAGPRGPPRPGPRRPLSANWGVALGISKAASAQTGSDWDAAQIREVGGWGRGASEDLSCLGRCDNSLGLVVLV